MAAVLTALLAAGMLALAMVVIWAVITGLRILRPERPLPFVPDTAARRHRATARGKAVPVGFREIHEDLRTHARSLPLPHHDRVTDGLPHASEPWMDDLYRRRN